MSDIAANATVNIGSVAAGVAADGKSRFQKMEDDGTSISTTPEEWSITTNATAGTATISKAAVAAKRHIARTITVSIAAGGTAQTPITAVVRDGATTAGTIIWQGAMSAPVNQSMNIVQTVNIPGTTNTAMTIEFTSASVASCIESITLTGFTVL